jgi:iron complex transport system substrate-binding protein
VVCDGARLRRVTRRLLAVAATLLAVAAIACRETQQRPNPSGSGGASTASGGATGAPTTASAWPRTIRDAFGETHTLTAPPQRIVSQTLGTDEILFAICQPQRIVGVSLFARDGAYSNVVDELRTRDVPAVDGAEDVLTLKPDLVFIASYSRAEVAELLRVSKAPVLRLSNFDRIDDVIANIRTVGRAIGEEAAADRVIADMKRRLASVSARAAASGRRPRVMSFDGLGYTAGGGTLFDDEIRAAGGVNVSAEQGVKGFTRVNGEQVIAWNPDYLICGAKPGQEADVRRRLLANPAIARSPVVKAGRLVLMDTRTFLTVSQHIVEAVEALADAMHGAVAR